MNPKSTVSGPLLDQISVLLSDAARNIDKEKHALIPYDTNFEIFWKDGAKYALFWSYQAKSTL